MEPVLLSLPIDFRFEPALNLLPERGSPPSEVMILGDSVRAIDAWGGVAVRAAIEYYAGRHQRRVTLSPPLDTEAWRLLSSLIRDEPPAHLTLSFDAADLPKVARSVLLPAVPFRTVVEAEQAAGVLVGRASGRTRRAVRFAASALPELVDNSLRWTSSTPVLPIASIIHERNEDEIQLVVVDLGEAVGRTANPAASLASAVAAAPNGGLTSLGEVAVARGIDASITLAAGVGRLYWRRNTWIRARGDPVRGFVAAVTVPVE